MKPPSNEHIRLLHAQLLHSFMIGSAAPYEIGRPSGTCAATGDALLPGDRIVVALVEAVADDGTRSLDRLEYKHDAWDEHAVHCGRSRLFGFWVTNVPDPAEVKPKPLIDNDALMDLFEQLGSGLDAGNPEHATQIGFRYLLALILIRKRLLSYEGGTQPDRKDGTPGELLVRPKGTPRPPEGPAYLCVIDPGMDDDQVAAATEQLGQVMNLDEDQPNRGDA